MKTHSTNYCNTFIEIAEDCPTTKGEIPPLKGEKKSIANHQFELIAYNPYQYSSDDVLFTVFTLRKELPKSEWKNERQTFFSKGQACLRTSPLCKRYGFGMHHNKNGKVALFGAETKEYNTFVNDQTIKKIKGMRSKKA